VARVDGGVGSEILESEMNGFYGNRRLVGCYGDCEALEIEKGEICVSGKCLSKLWGKYFSAERYLS